MTVQILDGESADVPGLSFDIVGYVCAAGFKFSVGGVNVFGEDPVDVWLESFVCLGEEDGDIFTANGADVLVGLEPEDVEAEDIAVIILCLFNIGNWKLGYCGAYCCSFHSG